MWETIAISVVSGFAGAVLVCWFNWRCRVKEEKRRALRDYFARFRYQGANRDFELLNEVYVSFSDSPEVLSWLILLRESGRLYPKIRKELVAVMCESAGVKYHEFLSGNDIGISGKS